MTRHLILHIGHAKTGTTTLQKTLVASRGVLIEQGILHPSTAPHQNNHRELIPYLVASEDATAMKAEAAKAKLLWQAVFQQIETEAPHTIILSSEQLFRAWSPSQMAAMMAKLRTLATRITVVAYIREPAASTLSTVQQALKSRPLPPTGLKMRDVRAALEAYQAGGVDAFKVKAFDRSVLVDGSVVNDFFARVLPEVKVSDLVMHEDRNTSTSAEAMAILQDIHSGKRRFHIGKPSREVRVADQQLPGFSRPRLLPDVRDALRASTTHYDWLRDTYGVTFPGLEMPDMDPDAARKILANVKTIEDMCNVDADRKTQLWKSLSRPDAMLRRLISPA